MTAPELTADERAVVDRFDAAPVLAESSPIVRAMLALAEEMDGLALPDREAAEDFDRGAAYGLEDAAARIRAAVATVLAADPEPRDAVIERMAVAIMDADYDQATGGLMQWSDLDENEQGHFRRLAVAALAAENRTHA